MDWPTSCRATGRRARSAGGSGCPGRRPGRGRDPRRRRVRHLARLSDHARPVRGGRSGRRAAARPRASASARSPTSSPTRRRTAATRQAVAARADRPAGHQGRRRHLRGLDARAGDRGAGARRRRCRGRDPRRGRPRSSATTSRKLKPGSPEAMALKEVLIEQGAVVASIWKSASARTPRSSPRRRRWPRSAPACDAGVHPNSTLEQPRAGGRAGRRLDAAGSSARRSATTSTCATSRAARRCCSARPRTTTPPAPIGPFIRLFDDDLLARRRAPADGDARPSRAPDGFRLEGSSLDRQDQPRPGRSRRAR